ncbi:uncharacterized protein CTHT_0015990 [Thermochaetoides thermophila DSM 1495]|uniref:WLM domain-containing protein n=1 Tax=Chaetomium thermophilum (strain DSM 1495 / CBS 144.50 / IMI 039719) TaxID=759272 RepID=G0S250_CHATD|nr:hypothetical protein CTHT_0015990 [Thermochaetoides thermophila DSM 1495]EGS23110.1 hypothetical protein CTHT_0015990 [Thermochaetoides thermophila DSM 1495]
MGDLSSEAEVDNNPIRQHAQEILDDTSIEIVIKFPPAQHTQTWNFSPSDTFAHLIQALSLEFPSYDWSKAKALPEKKPQPQGSGGVKPKAVYTPSADGPLSLSVLHGATLRFLAPQTSDLETLQKQQHSSTTQQARRILARAHQLRNAARPLSRSSGPRIATLSSPSGPSLSEEYTFQTLRPLSHLPNSHTSLSILEKLKNDPGIRHAMSHFRLRVQLLTEMDPLTYTSVSRSGDSVTRILGLNRNQGEVIELRLRLESTMQTSGGFARRLRGRLRRGINWGRGKGRVVGDGEGGEEFAPARDGEDETEEEGMVQDHGGWYGGTYVLGGGESGSSGTGGRQDVSPERMRALVAAAAELRMRKEREARERLEREERKKREEEGEKRDG